MGRKDVKVAELDTWCNEQLTSLDASENKTNITKQLKNFVSKWDRCSDKANERLSGWVGHAHVHVITLPFGIILQMVLTYGKWNVL